MPEKEILKRLVIGYLCFLATTECQPDTVPAGSGGFRMPSVSGILQQTDNLMRSLQGVGNNAQPGGQRDANIQQVSGPVQVTDIRGNAPPLPIGPHVDMPWEHGNNNNFPVVHRGHLPVGTSQGRGGINDINNIAQGSIVGTQTDNAFSSQSGINIGPSNIPPRGSVFTGSTVHHGQTESAINPNSFVDLAMQLNGGILNDGVRGNSGSPPVNSVAMGSHGVATAQIDVPGMHGNTQDHAIVHSAPASGDVTHVDLPNQHGNTLRVPVVHRPDTSIGLETNVSPTFDVLGGSTGSGFIGSQFVGSAHVDAQGLHGNTQDHAVVQTDTISSSGPGLHVDLPNQHGNTLNVPVVHRPDISSAIGLGTNVSPTFDVLGGSTGSGIFGSQVLGSTHVDESGLHGNTQDHAVVHTDAVSSSGSGIHVDLPNQHGNALNVPVVHRPDRHSAIGLGTNIFPRLDGSTGGDFIGSQIVDSAHVKGIPEQSVIIPGLSEVPAASTGQLHVPGSMNVLEHGSGGRRVNINNWGNLPRRNILSPDIQAELSRNMQINRPNPSGLTGSLLETMGAIIDSSGPVEAFISPRGRTSDPGISTGAGHNIGINKGHGWDRNINRHGSIGGRTSDPGRSTGAGHNIGIKTMGAIIDSRGPIEAFISRRGRTSNPGRSTGASHNIGINTGHGRDRNSNRHGSIGAVVSITGGSGGYHGRVRATLDSGRGQSNHQVQSWTVMDTGNGANAAKIRGHRNNETPSLSGQTYGNRLIRQIMNG